MPEPTVTLTLRFDPDLYARAKAQARVLGLSLNAWMQQAAAEKLGRSMPEPAIEPTAQELKGE